MAHRGLPQTHQCIHIEWSAVLGLDNKRGFRRDPGQSRAPYSGHPIIEP